MLYHITEWPFPGLIDPASLASEGFVHLSSASQLQQTAERWYKGHDEVGVLVLDEGKLGEALRWEDLYGHGEAFPHLYASLPAEALLAIVRMRRGADGRFLWPRALRGWTSPLAEGPEEGDALVEPSRRFPQTRFPEAAVLSFFPHSAPRNAVKQGSSLGASVWLQDVEGQQVAVANCGFGAPLAAIALEELIAMGCRRFVACGGAGSLTPDEKLGALVLVSGAFRDEGLSHHYLPPSLSIATEFNALQQAAERLASWGVAFREGATWTTDALYRETPTRIARRRKQGCLTVEMEAAALLAVAAYRKVPLVPLLVCGDDLGGETWDFRDWTSNLSTHEQTLRLAIRLAASL